MGKGAHRFPPLAPAQIDRVLTVTAETRPACERLLQGKILFTPGHTADSLSLRVDDVIFCGDAAMNGLPSRRRVTIWIEQKADFFRSWDVLLAENAPRLYPAHGRPFAAAQLRQYRAAAERTKIYPLQSGEAAK